MTFGGKSWEKVVEILREGFVLRSERAAKLKQVVDGTHSTKTGQENVECSGSFIFIMFTLLKGSFAKHYE